jgi:hypothetical protein
MASGFLAYLLQEVTPRRRVLPLAIALLLAAPATARAQGTAICHATGNPDSPYQQIDLSAEASFEHLQHAEDIVPAPPEGCPAQLVVDEVDPASPYPLPTATAQPDVVPDVPPQRPRRNPRRRALPRGQALPATSAGNLGATATVESETLPMTGAEVPGIALMGLGFLLAGAGLRLRFVAS